MSPLFKHVYFLVSTSLLAITPIGYASTQYNSRVNEEEPLQRPQASIHINDEKTLGVDESSVFLTPIEQIETTLYKTSHKRLVIGGLHAAPKDMKDFWILSQTSDIVINTDIMSKPDIKLNALTAEGLNDLNPLSLLLKNRPDLRFNEIIFEHVGFSTDLENLLKNTQILSQFTEMLVPGGLFKHQSSFMAMKQSDGIFGELPKEFSFQSSFEISQKFGGLISYAAYEKLPNHSSQKLDEVEYNRLAKLKNKYDSTRTRLNFFDLQSLIPAEELENYKSEMEKIWTSKKSPLIIFNERTILNKSLLPLFEKESDRKNWQDRIEIREVEYELLKAFPKNTLVYSTVSFVDKLIKELMPGNSIFIEPADYDIAFKTTSILLRYLKNIENLGYLVELWFESPRNSAMNTRLFAFDIRAKKL